VDVIDYRVDASDLCKQHEGGSNCFQNAVHSQECFLLHESTLLMCNYRWGTYFVHAFWRKWFQLISVANGPIVEDYQNKYDRVKYVNQHEHNQGPFDWKRQWNRISWRPQTVRHPANSEWTHAKEKCYPLVYKQNFIVGNSKIYTILNLLIILITMYQK